MPKKNKRKRDSSARDTATQAPAPTPDERLAPFVVRNLTALAREGRLTAAHGVATTLRRLEGLLEAGRSPVLVGDRGVGKTALIEELARRGAGGDGPLGGTRVVEISLLNIVRGTKDRSQLGRRLDELESALRAAGDVVPYFSDLHVAWDLDLESTIESLCHRLGRPFLAEGEVVRVDWMLEYRPSLERHLAVARIAEPTLDQARLVATAWAHERALPDGRPCVESEALELMLDIAHRYLVRDCLPRTVLEPLGELVAVAGGASSVGVEEVVARMSDGLGLPRDLVDPRVRLDLDGLRATLASAVLGQPEAANALVDAVGLAKAGLADPSRPLGVFLFSGPTGVGKTQLVRSLAEALGGRVERVARLNMADYRSEEAADLLFGYPNANSVASRRGVLTRRVTGQTFGLLLLDEFEKASDAVHDRFMQLFDEGVFLNGEGETVSCRALIVVATSNAGAQVWRRGGFDSSPRRGDPELERALDASLEEHFRVELLNRFDRIVHFAPLDRDDVLAIARRELDALGRRGGLVRRRLRLEVSERVVELVAREGYDVELGVRPLRRVVERRVAPVVARSIVSDGAGGELGRTRVLRLDVENRLDPGGGSVQEITARCEPYPGAGADGARLATG